MRETLSKTGLEPIFRLDNRDLWDSVHEQIDYQYLGLGNSDIDYYFEVESSNDYQCIDLSCVVLENKIPVAIWPISVSPRRKALKVSSHGNLIEEPSFVKSTSLKIRTRVSKLCFRFTQLIAQHLRESFFQSVSRLKTDIQITPWHLTAIQSGSTCKLHMKPILT